MYCIKSKSLGKFLGVFLGLAIFEDSVDGEKIEPAVFETFSDAQETINLIPNEVNDCVVEEL